MNKGVPEQDDCKDYKNYDDCHDYDENCGKLYVDLKKVPCEKNSEISYHDDDDDDK